MGKHIPLNQRTKANDIKFKGFLSYRHLRIIGWAFLAIAQIAVVFKIAIAVDKTLTSSLEPWINVISFFSDIPLPLFLLANLAVILQKKDDFKYLLIKFGGMALGMYALANIIVLHYGYGMVHALFSGADVYTACQFVGLTLANLGRVGYSLNIFIDLFLFVLIFFFLNYQPKKYFQGKTIYIFRAFVAIPILYEIASIAMKICMVNNLFYLPSYFFFLLTSKPPFLFLAFAILVILMKIREYRHLKKHQSTDLLNEHYETNAHSLRISITIVVIIIICSVIDFIVTSIVAVSVAWPYLDNVETVEYGLDLALRAINMVGLGFAASIILIPIILCFSYKKSHKKSIIDTLIPVVGVAVIFFIYFEGLFLIITERISAFMEMIMNFINNMKGGSEEAGESVEEAIKNLPKL